MYATYKMSVQTSKNIMFRKKKYHNEKSRIKEYSEWEKVSMTAKKKKKTNNVYIYIYALKAIPARKRETTARFTITECINLMNCF